MNRPLILTVACSLGVMLLSACGSGPQAEPSPSPAPAPAASTSGSGGTAATSPPAVENEQPQQRTVSTSKGDIAIPFQPERVVGLSVVYPDLLYALGTVPAAVQNYHAELPEYLAEPLQSTLKMGIARVPDFEAILSVNPDLIVAPEWWADKDFEQLSQIAPTVLLPQRDDWRDELRDIAEVLGNAEAAEAVIRRHEEKTAATKQQLDELVGDETVLYMRIMPKEIVLHGIQLDRGSFVHHQLGLEPVPSFPQDQASLSISLEVLPDYDADHILIQIDDDSNEETVARYEEMIDNSLWRNMKAVRNGQVYLVGGKEWFNLGMSPLADQHAMDNIVDAFRNGQPQ